MRRLLLFTALLAPALLAAAESVDDLNREMQLEVSLAYSQCAAFYETAASDSSVATGLTREEARTMQIETMTRAIAHASTAKGSAAGLLVAKANLVEARIELADLFDADPQAFSVAMNDYRRSCRMGVIDPPGFVDKTLAAGRWRQTQFKLPEGMTVRELLENAQPVERLPEISDCSKPAIGHLLSLDDMIVEGGMVCAKHTDGACDSERDWMSFAQFVEKRYPDNELLGFTEKLSISFKGGRTLRKRTLIACLVVPEVRT